MRNLGEPVPETVRANLFRAYPHGARPTAPGSPQGGLGLSIVDQCVRNLGGLVWLESSAEQGTAFHFTVPLTLTSSVDPTAAG